MDPHAFCRHLLLEARAEALDAGVDVPKHLTALKSSFRDHYFIEADGIEGVEITGDCAFDVKAKYILGLVATVTDGR